ncbi:4-hydroxythreonine-4-phosphate dehydrogenase [Mesorhizobium sp. IMUNJ 23232]|uniref:4-hydroxythreonine-4-phosphate dehydrogenase n=1 Tax=Mesorhizobium sp. IMUNJ 23232 TaxID=3376064 RepID=UPI00379E19E0
MMDFIFMLTRDDRTVEDSLDLMRLIEPVGLKHLGFKDIGVPPAVLKTLVADIHGAGAVSYMEVVSTTSEACLQSARIARDLGVQRLLGGTQVDEILEVLDGSETTYFPFPGRPVGHPTKLGGTAADVEADCRGFVGKGCAGCDILAYRATEADPIDLVRAARKGLGPDKYLIVAGAVTSVERIRAVKAAGADAFTIGTAVFNGSYSPSKGSILSQLRDVLADCESA